MDRRYVFTITPTAPLSAQIAIAGCRANAVGVLDLSFHEYKLLGVLMARPGKVFSRNQLLDLAWEEPEASMDRTIDAHIKNIRSKMKRVNPDLDPIVTHRGLGYALKENL